jgi:hypothetical protein
MDNIIAAHATTYRPLDPSDISHRRASGRFSAFFSNGNSFTSAYPSSTGLLYNGHYIVWMEGARAVKKPRAKTSPIFGSCIFLWELWEYGKYGNNMGMVE